MLYFCYTFVKQSDLYIGIRDLYIYIEVKFSSEKNEKKINKHFQKINFFTKEKKISIYFLSTPNELKKLSYLLNLFINDEFFLKPVTRKGEKLNSVEIKKKKYFKN